MPLTYLSNIFRTLGMSLINCKVELKLKWKNYCVLASARTENEGATSDNIIFNVKDKKLYVPIVILSAKKIRKLSKLGSNDFQD